MDYNIYIHNVDSSGTTTNFTKAWTSGNEASQTKAWSSIASGQQGEQTNQFAKETSPVAAFRGVTAAAKAHPAVAAAVAVVMMAKMVVDGLEKVSQIQSTDTGDYRFATHMGNLQANLNILLHPVTTAIQFWNTGRQNKIYNRGQEQQRELLGDAFVNSYNRKI